MSRLPIRALLLLVLVLPACGCLFHSKHVPLRTTATGVKSATLPELVDIINKVADSVQTLNLTVDIDTTVGGAKKGKVTEYQQIRGYILVRRPEMLRMIGLFPIVRNRAFDMVSDGREFKLYIPTKNRFIVGSAEVSQPSNKPLENLRPQVIYDALLLHHIDPKTEIAVLEQTSAVSMDAKTKRQTEVPEYTVDIIQRDPDGNGWHLHQKVTFSRLDLRVHRQVIYDRNGVAVTEARYEKLQEYSGVLFPTDIDIWRPLEEYSIGITVVKAAINQPIADDQFALTQPAGSELVRMGTTPETNTSELHDGGKGDKSH